MQPEQVKIAITKTDGSIVVMSFITKEFRHPPLTEEQINDLEAEHRDNLVKDTEEEISAIVRSKDQDNGAIDDARLSLVEKLSDKSIQAFRDRMTTHHIVWEREASEENINAELQKYTWGPEVVSWRIITDEEIPEDRYFRNAWKDEEGITVDMEKARDVQRDKLRLLRAPVLAKLDVEYMRADEGKDEGTKDEISAKKQALRDVTKDPRIDEAQTPEELKEIGKELL